MTEITQADRDAAAQYDVVEAFARHRETAAAEERAKIVAWLRKTANMNPQTPEASTFVLLLCKAIEAGEHLK